MGCSPTAPGRLPARCVRPNAPTAATESEQTMGRLDVANPSLWVGTTPEGASQPLSGDTGADVCVIGAGIAGLCTALLLAQEGRSVCVIEADRVASGVTGFTTAKITALHGLKYGQLIKTHGEDIARAYAEANQAAVE